MGGLRAQGALRACSLDRPTIVSSRFGGFSPKYKCFADLVECGLQKALLRRSFGQNLQFLFPFQNSLLLTPIREPRETRRRSTAKDRWAFARVDKPSRKHLFGLRPEPLI